LKTPLEKVFNPLKLDCLVFHFDFSDSSKVLYVENEDPDELIRVWGKILKGYSIELFMYLRLSSINSQSKKEISASLSKKNAFINRKIR
jgi:hypothetical protein